MSWDERERSDERLSIWSVPSAWKVWFLALFTLQSVLGLGYLIYRTLGESTGWGDVLFIVVTGMGPVGLGSAVVSFTTLGLAEVVMLLHNEIQKVQEDRRRAIEKRRAEVHRQWQDWIEANPAVKEAMESPGVTRPPSVEGADGNGRGSE